MRVEIERDADGCVAEPFGYDLGVDAGLEGEGGMGVSQVVESDRWDAGLLDEVGEPMGEAVRVNRGTVLPREDQPRVAPCRPCRCPLDVLALLVSPERSEGRSVERNPSPALLGLRGRLDGAPVHRRDGVDDGQPTIGEIDIGPSQPEHLAATHAGGGEDDERGEEAVVADGRQERVELGRAPRALLVMRYRRWAGSGSGVADDEAEALGVGERPTQHRVQVADRLRSETVLDQAHVHLLDLERCQILHSHLAELVVELGDRSAVAGRGGRFEVGRDPLQPFRQVLAEAQRGTLYDQTVVRGDDHPMHRLGRFLFGREPALGRPTALAGAGVRAELHAVAEPLPVSLDRSRHPTDPFTVRVVRD